MTRPTDGWTLLADALPEWDGPSFMGCLRSERVLMSDGYSIAVVRHQRWDGGPSEWVADSGEFLDFTPTHWRALPPYPEMPV